MKVLVCGGRDYKDSFKLNDVLHEFHKATPIKLLINGGADGADTLAFAWAILNQIPNVTIKANWKKYGRKAGPIRNQKMLDDFSPDLVIAFPGGVGTDDMVRRATRASVPVKRVGS